MVDKLENLTKVATRFRFLIEEADWSKLTIEFENFPVNSCGDVSILLAEYLIDSGYGTPIYVVGELVEHPRVLSHAWIELDGVVADITADGFDPNAPRVIVTEKSVWHNQFSRFDEHLVAIDLYEDYTASRLRAAYKEIIRLRIH